METLVRLSESGNSEAAALRANIEELAGSIQTIGLKYPILVRKTAKGYLVVDGERRYWACVWLQCDTIPCVISPLGEDCDTVRWSTNMQRSDVPCIDIAEWVAREHEHILRSIENDQQPPTETVSAGMLKSSASEAAWLLVASKLEDLSGRKWATRSLRMYKRFATDITVDTKRLASALQANYKVLERVVRIKGEAKQLAALRMELGLVKPSPADTQGGRPTMVVRVGNLFDQALSAMSKLDDAALAKASAEDAQNTLTRLVTTRDQLGTVIRRLQKRLKVVEVEAHA